MSQTPSKHQILQRNESQTAAALIGKQHKSEIRKSMKLSTDLKEIIA